MPFAATAALIAVVLFIFAPTAVAATAVELPVSTEQALAIASQAFPESPCAGRLVIVIDDTIGERRPGAVGEALGRQFVDGEWRTVDCRIALEPEFVDCDVIVHEAGHLAGIDEHATHGVMRSEPEPFPACHPTRSVTRRESAILAMREALPPRAWRLNCNARVTRCTASAPGARYVRYFTVAPDGTVFTAGKRLAASR